MAAQAGMVLILSQSAASPRGRVARLFRRNVTQVTAARLPVGVTPPCQERWRAAFTSANGVLCEQERLSSCFPLTQILS